MSGLPDFLHLRTTAFPPSTSPFSAPPPCVPSPTKLVPVTIHFPDPQLDDMRTLLRLSPLAPPTFENSQPRFGQATRDWVASAREAWLDPERFDWRTGAEAKLNALPNFMVTVRDDMLGYEFKLHFVALFSSQSTAVPIVLMHGWPGSILEFLPLLSLLLERYPDAGELAYHVVVPSLPGFGLSGAPPVDRDFTLADLTRVMDAFMVGLGFGRKDSGGGGYVAQGGDIGSMVARMLAKYSNCRAIHVNFMAPGREDYQFGSTEGVTAEELAHLERGKQWVAQGMGYATMHATRPGTIGLVLSSSPLALLAWIGEKFLEWPDQRHPLHLTDILSAVTLYWLARCYPSSLYVYREIPTLRFPNPGDKPCGYSYFPAEISCLPAVWCREMVPGIVRYEHDRGGHFAALEQPELLLDDVEDFVRRYRHLFS